MTSRAARIAATLLVVPVTLCGCSAVGLVDRAAKKGGQSSSTQTSPPAPVSASGSGSPSSRPSSSTSSPVDRFVGTPGARFPAADFFDAVRTASQEDRGFRFVAQWPGTKGAKTSQVTYTVETSTGSVHADVTQANIDPKTHTAVDPVRTLDPGDGYFYEAAGGRRGAWYRQRSVDASDDRKETMRDLDDVLAWVVTTDPEPTGDVVYQGGRSGSPDDLPEFAYVRDDRVDTIRVDAALRMRNCVTKEKGVVTGTYDVTDYGSISPIEAPAPNTVIGTLPKETATPSPTTTPAS